MNICIPFCYPTNPLKKCLLDKTSMPTLSTIIHHSNECPRQFNQARKITGIHTGSEEEKIFVGDTVVFIENLQTPLKDLEIINRYVKVPGDKINVQNSIIFLTNNGISESEMKKNPIYNFNEKDKMPRNKLNK